MNNVVVDFLYDYAVTLTYETHDSGSVNYKRFLEEYCDNQNLDDIVKKTFEDYTNYSLCENHGWFPEKEEIADWYVNYKKVKV